MENINLIRKVAWSFHHTTGLDWDDLFQEAALAYCEALGTYDKKKGKLTTHMWHVMTNHLGDYIHQVYSKDSCLEGIEVLVNYPHTEESFLESLTRDAWEMAHVVLITPKKYVVLDQDKARERIIRVFAHRGWSPQRIARAFLDLQQACLIQ
jgi:hypothetical protein